MKIMAPDKIISISVTSILLVVHRYMVDIFEKPELRFGITGNQRFPGSCDVIATVCGPFRQSCGSAVRCPFRCAQEDLFMGFSSELRSRGLNYDFSDP
jgi:hypothetical protein